MLKPCATALLPMTCVLLLAACGSPSASKTQGTADTNADHWREIAPLCAGYPSKVGCDDGDMVLFAGLLCAAGESRGCDLVRDSQDGDGRWWRSPRRRGGNLGEGASFSRDMAMGVYLYLISTRDKGAADRWLDWIEGHRPCDVPKPGGGCLVRGPERFCTDEVNHSGTLAPANWSLMERVWTHLGMHPSANMRHYAGIDAETLPVEAAHAGVGYALHLTAVETLFKQQLDVTPELRRQAANSLAGRQPDNLFYRYLADGPSPALYSRLVSLCPKPGDGRRGGDQWSWERDTGGSPWQDSMGWDCLFLGNLLAAARGL